MGAKFALARQEKDPVRIPEICARARRLIQNRPLELATFNRKRDDKIAELEAAVRDLWVIEQKDKKTSSWKPTLAQRTRKDGAPGAGAFSALTCLAKPGGWQ